MRVFLVIFIDGFLFLHMEGSPAVAAAAAAAALHRLRFLLIGSGCNESSPGVPKNIGSSCCDAK